MAKYLLVKNYRGEYGILRRGFFGKLRYRSFIDTWIESKAFRTITPEEAEKWWNEVVYGYEVIKEEQI